jgi:hypothetical protein
MGIIVAPTNRAVWEMSESMYVVGACLPYSRCYVFINVILIWSHGILTTLESQLKKKKYLLFTEEETRLREVKWLSSGNTASK